jgi:hypothetical protein
MNAEVITDVNRGVIVRVIVVVKPGVRVELKRYGSKGNIGVNASS